MKSYVAGLLVLAFSSGIITQGQTPPRAGNKTANKPRSDTIKICQGVPVPDGYVVVAYMTSAACPHGAYILKKQDQYESSLAINGDSRQIRDSKEPSSSTTKPITSTARRSNSSQQAKPVSQPTSKADKQTSPASQVSSATRPRRVGVAQPQVSKSEEPAATQQIAQTQDTTTATQDGPPTLIGSQPALTLRPPTLTNAGSRTQDSSTPEDAGKLAAPAQPTPEEVDEGDVVRVD
ncbi:MAG TPA: hypothetical protein VEL78_03060, partial [Pyrinomonadaceae bacterium]|nr:hypothetical protein [Pyrinomonadaceae bacterium]